MKRFLILFLSILSQQFFAQAQFEARVSKNAIGINERLRIDFYMNFDGDNFVPPNFEGFRIIAGPSQQVSQSWINGRSTFEKAYSYFLVPTKKGNLTIKPAVIEFNGQNFKTNSVKIQVTNAVQEEEPENYNQQAAPENAIFLVAEISKTTPYINEPITVVYKLFFNNIGITGFEELAKPKYNDFWNQNIDIKELKEEVGIYNGQRYRAVVLRKTILYPQKSGKLVIEPLSLRIGVQVPTNRRDVYGRYQIVDDVKKVSAGAKTIRVKALPEVGKPEGFTGAVGRFDFKVTPSKTELKSGESLDLMVSATGKGNLKLFALPKPVVPNALEMYDAVHAESVTTPLSGMAGKISDSYTIVPQFKGSYAIKPLSFSYFDLDTGTYKTIVSSEVLVTVLDGPTATDTTNKANAKEAKNSNLEQFKFIKRQTELEDVHAEDFFGSNGFYALLLLPFGLLPLIVLYKKRKEAASQDVFGNRIKMNNRLAKKYLSEAKKQVANKALFYVALEKAMHNFLKAKLHIETSEMSKDNIQDLLQTRKVDKVAISEFIALTENCEIARYAPASSASIQEDFDKAVEIISALEKQIV